MSGFDVELEIERGNSGDRFRLHASFRSGGGTTVVYGASGAGKTSLLLALLGALGPRSGRLRVAGHDLFDSASGLDVPVRERRLGIVFQDALLFPHLDALHNVRFGLRGRGSRERAREWLARVGAERLERRLPGELSGGQRQRVALARCLAAAPRAVLLDEPFSALDPAARAELGRLVVELQRASGVPFLHVTHDLGEALRQGDTLVLLGEGRVLQAGRPSEVVARPRSLEAARSVGTQNLFVARILEHMPERGCTAVDLGGTRVETTLLDRPAGSRVALGLRAEEILVSREPTHGTSARNVLAGTIRATEAHGPFVELHVETPVPIRVLLTPVSVRELGLAPSAAVYLLIKASAFHALE